MFDAFLHSKAFQDMIRAAVQEALRSPEGQDILTQAVRKELAGSGEHRPEICTEEESL